ncbi:MAG: hypothetical protein HRU21_04190 [Pseudomonadales bacterium]|nr:hypothetical protein [Pseudomonadales bacterium]
MTLTVNQKIMITAVQRDYRFVQDAKNRRAPKVGDVAVVKAVLNQNMLGYELACFDRYQQFVWQMKLADSAIEYKRLD